MSSAILQGGASGTGSMTLLASNTNSNQVINMPDVTGTMLTNKSTGTVLQVVNASITSQASTTSSTYSSTGLSANITPSSTSSKILAIANLNAGFGSTNASYSGFRLNRNSGTIIGASTLGNGVNASIYEQNSVAIVVLDSPSSTSSVSYVVEFAITNNASAFNTQINPPTSNTTLTSSLTLIEIAG